MNLPSVPVWRVSWLPWRRTKHIITGCLTADSFKLWLDGEPAFHLCKVGEKFRSTLLTTQYGEITLDLPPRVIVEALFGRQIVEAFAHRIGW